MRKFIYLVRYRIEFANGKGVVGNRMAAFAEHAAAAGDLVREYCRRFWKANENVGDLIQFKEIILLCDDETILVTKETLDEVVAYSEKRARGEV